MSTASQRGGTTSGHGADAERTRRAVSPAAARTNKVTKRTTRKAMRASKVARRRGQPGTARAELEDVGFHPATQTKTRRRTKPADRLTAAAAAITNPTETTKAKSRWRAPAVEVGRHAADRTGDVTGTAVNE
jgi:hypothetical protein